jgi:hypothetical protein
MGPIELNIAKLFQDPQGSGGGTGTSGLFELVLEGARRGSYAADYSQSDTDYDAAPRTREELNHRRDAEPLDLDRDDDARLAARGLDRDHDDGDAKPEPRPSAAHDRAEYEEDRPSSRSDVGHTRSGIRASKYPTRCRCARFNPERGRIEPGHRTACRCRRLGADLECGTSRIAGTHRYLAESHPGYR